MIEKYMILTNNIQLLKTYFNKLEWRIYKIELYIYIYILNVYVVANDVIYIDILKRLMHWIFDITFRLVYSIFSLGVQCVYSIISIAIEIAQKLFI